MKEITVLSIVVPTFKRAECLRLLLSSITSDIENWPIDLEVIVLDNASPDDTKIIVSEFSTKFPIKYFCHKENIGMDANIAACFDIATGKYLWVLGDDEILYKNTLNHVLNLCRNQEFGILYLENSGFKEGEEFLVTQYVAPINPKINSMNSRRMFREVNVFLTFISANIINRAAVLNKYPNFDFKTDTGTFLPQMAWTYSVLEAVDSHIYIHSPMFGAMTGNTGGYKLIQVFGINLINITKKYFGTESTKAANIMSNAVVTRLLPGELMHQFSDTNEKSKFEYEDMNSVVELCFGNNIYGNIFLRNILSKSILKRKIAFFSVRVFNKINKYMRYAFL